ncbi:MAG: hypothetical protein HOM41_01295 [Flavobacteriales bacterium]|jgi:hypothetical protein|nr:hypothetical protein [Flavobacteriales bacterium]MBT6175516.1 hypothetical protein [Flavobacteriales bacterium]
MPLHFDNVRKAVHAMLNDVVEQGFKHSLEFPNDSESAHKIIENANTSLTDIINFARKDNLMHNADVKQEAFRHTIKQAEKTSLKLLSEIQQMRRHQIMTKHKLKKSDLVTK